MVSEGPCRNPCSLATVTARGWRTGMHARHGRLRHLCPFREWGLRRGLASDRVWCGYVSGELPGSRGLLWGPRARVVQGRQWAARSLFAHAGAVLA